MVSKTEIDTRLFDVYFKSRFDILESTKNINILYKIGDMERSKTKCLMGTEITITIFGQKDPDSDIQHVFEIFQTLEDEFSRFKSESSLSRVNRERIQEVSNTYIDVLNKCKEIYTDTDFHFNPLINVRQLGYSKDFHSKQFKKEDNDIQVNLELDTVEIKGNKISLQEGQNIDLGGIVKGYSVDKAREYLDRQGYKNYIVNAGGDIYTAGTNEEGGKIIVGIDNPYTKDKLFATIEVEDRAIATSGNYKRKWTIEEKEYTHIINPMTSDNNNEIISITLIGDVCYLVDAYATACIAMGVEKTLKFLKKNQLEGVIMGNDKKIYTTIGMKKYAITYI